MNRAKFYLIPRYIFSDIIHSFPMEVLYIAAYICTNMNNICSHVPRSFHMNSNSENKQCVLLWKWNLPNIRNRRIRQKIERKRERKKKEISFSRSLSRKNMCFNVGQQCSNYSRKFILSKAKCWKNKVSVKELFYVNTKCYTKRYTFCISFMYQYNLCSCALSISSRNWSRRTQSL